ncbi:MAG TPA: AMP-binding protein, partial [Pseudonocardia sp.]
MDIDVTSLHHRRAVNRWERVSVGDIAERLVWSYPDQEALIGRPGCYAAPEFERLTYRQVNELTAQLANGLLAAGLHRGDRVLLYGENSVEAFLAKLAIARAGLVCVPINPTLAPDVLAYLISTTEPRFAIVEAGLWERARQPFQAHRLRPGITIPLGGDPVPGSVSFADFVATQPLDEPDVEIHGDDIWQILFTSGTTALHKGAMISHNASYFAAYNFAL